MEALILFFVSFIIIYLFYLFFVILNKKKMSKFKENIYFNFLVKTYKLDTSKISLQVLAHIISLANAFIIASSFAAICFVDSFFLKMLLAFAILIPLQLVVYFIIGKILQKKFGRKI